MLRGLDPHPRSSSRTCRAWRPAPKGMRIALWSDGQMQIQRNADEMILFSVEETRLLVRYLERLAESAE